MKEKIKDIGRKIFGQGEEVRFKNEAQEYAKKHGVSLEDAQRTLVLERMGNVQKELSFSGVIDASSKDYKRLQAALNEVLGKRQLVELIKNSEDPTIFKHIAVSPVVAADIAHATDYYKKQFNGRAPAFGVVRDTAETAKLMEALCGRIAAHPGVSSGPLSFGSFVIANPDLGADIGKILAAKRMLERHERHFSKDLHFEAATKRFKQTARDSFAEMVWRGPLDFVSSLTSSGLAQKSFMGFVNEVMSQSVRFAAREVWAGTKAFASLAHVAGSFMKNKMAR